MTVYTRDFKAIYSYGVGKGFSEETTLEWGSKRGVGVNPMKSPWLAKGSKGPGPVVGGGMTDRKGVGHHDFSLEDAELKASLRCSRGDIEESLGVRRAGTLQVT